jgi:hypothetical protein
MSLTSGEMTGVVLFGREARNPSRSCTRETEDGDDVGSETDVACPSNRQPITIAARLTNGKIVRNTGLIAE